MTAEEIRDALALRGYPCRIRHGEVVVETCLYCGNSKWNLEISAGKGLYHCWACRKGGRADALLSSVTGAEVRIPVAAQGAKRVAAPQAPNDDTPTVPVAEVPSALEYLATRGIDAQVATRYGIKVCLDAKHALSGRVLLPALDFWAGTFLGWVGRSYTGRRPKYLSTLGQRQLTGWRVRERDAPTVFVEGHFDGIAVHRAGYYAAVFGGMKTDDVLFHAARMSPGVPVIVLLDGDALAMARSLTWTLRTVHSPVYLAELPATHDPAQFRPEVLRAFLERTRGDSLSAVDPT